MPGRLRAVTPEYRRNRARLLASGPLCQSCFVAEATEADHRVPYHEGGSDRLDNLVPLCFPCHAAKSARERKGF